MLHSLLVGTTGGLFRLPDGPKLVALPGQLINHCAVTACGSTAAVAVPAPAAVLHKLYGLAPGQLDSGLHVVDDHGAKRVWQGDARSAAVWDEPGSGVGLAVGTEPADVLTSANGGASWAAAGFGSAATRGQWTFPPPPHQPHVLSIERLPGGGAAQLVAGVEVGGVLVGAAGQSGWAERSSGLYTDVHSCRVDPHDPQHWLVVTGRGLYATRDAGGSWRQAAADMWRGRYTVGLAFNPDRQGEVLVTAGDRPPAIGVHVYRSVDGGESFTDITEAAFGCPGCSEARGSRTPVPYFIGDAALLGTDTGHLLVAADAERQEWRVAARVPHGVTCVAAPGRSPSSVMH